MNKVILTGNLCQELELKQTSTGKSVLTNCIAVQRDYKNEKGEYDSDFINIVAWGSQAEYLKNYANKGDRVELVGKWQVRKYQANDGTPRTANECVIESIKAFNRQPKAETETPSYNPYGQTNFETINDEDLPF